MKKATRSILSECRCCCQSWQRHAGIFMATTSNEVTAREKANAALAEKQSLRNGSF